MAKHHGLIKSIFGFTLKSKETTFPAKPPVDAASSNEPKKPGKNTPAKIVRKKSSKPTKSIAIEAWESRRSTDLLMSSPVSRMFPLPVQRPKKNKNGKYDPYIRKIRDYTFILEPSDKYGCPSVLDGLFLLFFIDRARAIQNKKLSFKTVDSIFQGLGYSRNGRHYRMLKDALNRLMHSGMYILGENDSKIALQFITAAKMNGLNKGLDEAPQIRKGAKRSEQGLTVVLGDLFYEYANKGSSPYDLAVLRLLANKPGALGLYLNVASRSFSLLAAKKKSACVGLMDFLYEIGSGDIKSIRNARKCFRKISSEVDQALKQTGVGSVPTFLDKNDVVHIFAKAIVPGSIQYAASVKALPGSVQPTVLIRPKSLESIPQEPKLVEVRCQGLTREVQAKIESLDLKIADLKRALETESNDSIREEFIRTVCGLEKTKGKLLKH